MGDPGATRVFLEDNIVPNYEVTLEVDPDRAGEMEDYMRAEHIPEILRTGCFSRITLVEFGVRVRIPGPERGGTGRSCRRWPLGPAQLPSPQ